MFEQLADFPIPEYSVTKFHHVLCAVCASKFANCVRKMESAINEYKKVELVSIRYKGKKRYRGEEIYIETKYYKNREEAENVLRILACYYGKSLVLDFCYDKDIAEEETEKGGTYKYAVWSARGKAVEGY
ncbi:MAG: hypothetical protein Q4D56_05955 [Bacteroides sp.]|nr:hypothetical protein [Bacteroides sp.]